MFSSVTLLSSYPLENVFCAENLSVRGVCPLYSANLSAQLGVPSRLLRHNDFMIFVQICKGVVMTYVDVFIIRHDLVTICDVKNTFAF